MSKALKEINQAIQINKQRVQQLKIKQKLNRAEEDKEFSLLDKEEDMLYRLKRALEEDLKESKPDEVKEKELPVPLPPKSHGQGDTIYF